MTEINGSTRREFIVFRLSGQDYCVDVMRVREIRGWTHATAIPRSQEFMLGVINLRGTVLPIIDLAVRFGFPRAEPTARNAIIVAEFQQRTIGILVESVSDILQVLLEDIQDTPDVASTAAQEFVSGVIATEGRMISVISADSLFSHLEAIAA